MRVLISEAHIHINTKNTQNNPQPRRGEQSVKFIEKRQSIEGDFD